MRTTAIGVIIALLLAASARAAETAEVVYRNGRIYTVDPRRPWAEAVAIRGGRFVKVGTAAEMTALVGASTRVVDLEGRLVLPGLIDSHTHPSFEAEEPWHYATSFPWTLVKKHDRLSAIFRPSHARRVAALATSLELMSSFGITAIGDGKVVPEVLPVWETLVGERRLPQHVVLFMRVLDAEEPARIQRAWQIVDAVRRHALPGVRIGAKIYVDGYLERRTAYLVEPYREPGGSRGAPSAPPELIRTLVEELDAAGLPIQVHAIGDAGVRLALDALEPVMRRRAGGSGPAHMVLHAKLVHRDDVARFAELGVGVSVEPYWAQPSSGKELLARTLGAARLEEEYLPLRTLWDAGAVVGSNSDWASATMNPFYGMYVGVTRQSPHGRVRGKQGAASALTLEQMIRSYTLNNAVLLGLDGETGSIEAGKSADLVVLDRNVLERPIEELLETRVVKTIFRGKVVHDDTMKLPEAVERTELELLQRGRAH